jgi:hypothetical protein
VREDIERKKMKKKVKERRKNVRRGRDEVGI